MIKQIQLRGISRNPSDRYTADGGCAESLNVFLDNDETAPALRPVVVNSNADGMFPTASWGNNWEAVFIHKTPNYEKAIIRYRENLMTKLGVWNGSGCDEFMRLNINEVFVRCISSGNALGVVTYTNENGKKNYHTRWVLMKDGDYKLLGTSIPFPHFTVANVDMAASDDIVREIEYEYIWNNTVTPDTDYPTGTGGLGKGSLSRIWDEISLAQAKNARSGVYNKQQFFVLALRLFDGTRIISAPILLAPGFDNPYSITYYGVYNKGSEKIGRETATIKFRHAYKVFFRLDEAADFLDDWSDIIDSFEIYLSPQIEADKSASYFSSYTETRETEDSDVFIIINGQLVLGKEKAALENYLNASNFYRVYTADTSSGTIDKLREGFILDTKDFMSTDSLVTSGIRLDTLSDMKHYEVGFTRATLYNNKVVASGISEKVQMEMHNPIATYYLNLSIGSYTRPQYTSAYLQVPCMAYRMTFYLRDSSGKSFAVRATENGSEYFIYENQTIEGYTLRNNAYGMIICPDARAYAVDIQAVYGDKATVLAGGGNIVGSATLSLTPHPYLDCSYWYGDIVKQLISYCTETAAYTPGLESYMDDKPNRVYMSEMDNPFVFPTASRYTMNSKVLGCAIATAALSEGQFGQFPIYVFTEEGIWAMESASDGTIVSTKPMSREVCNNPDSITPIDNAVVFTTDKTVMLLSGSQITDISPFMNGKHYTMDLLSREAQLIGAGDWSPFLRTMADDTHFMAFMENARIAYDYKGNRLVFIKGNETFQYVYMLRTNTWHRLFVDGDMMPTRFTFTLNAYPDAYVNVQSGNLQYVWSLSSELDVTSTESIKGVIVTRPFDLGSPDVRKLIRDIRIRGYFNKRDVRYILQGSMDGINWGVLPSLHGGSYKWFRLIILSSLTPTERISWIDIDYDTKFQNRLR